MSYTIRLFETRDANALAELTLSAIRSVGSARYSPDQVKVWASRHPGPERFVARAAQGHVIFVAASDTDEIAAYALLEPDGHLDMLYCDPDHTRRGLADRLLESAEQHARSLKLERVYTEASELARAAFQRAGYTATHRREFEIDGVTIHNYAMEKPLK